MDDYSGKRAVGRVVVPRKGSSSLRDTADNKDQNAQFCNRIGCSGRLHHTKVPQIGFSDRPKSVKPSFSSSSGKEIIGSSSRTCSVASHSRKSFKESRKKLSNQLETDSSGSSSVQDESEVPELITSPRRMQTGFQSELRDAESSKIALMEAGSPSAVSKTRPRKMFRQKSELGNQDTLLGSSVSSTSESSGRGASDCANASSYGLRNLRCNSILDILPQGCSSSESNIAGKDMVKKRNLDGKSSYSVRGMKMSSSDDGRTSLSNSGISISDFGQARKCPPSREIGVASVRTQRSVNGNNRMWRLNQVSGNNSSPIVSHVVIPQVHQPETPINVNIASSLNQFSSEASSSRSSSYSHPNGNDNLPNMVPISSTELGITHLTNRDGSRRYNMDGIAEVLLALERIEQDEELAYEHLLALESNLFHGGLNFYDQHRDMRMDIDNMSYEELLALEEKMGTVSTALSEEALSKCLRRSIYQPTSPEEGAMGCSGNVEDIKCSICQEEYMVGDEVGRMGCDHRYHLVCIQQWLRLKNWCPICKVSVVPPQSTLLS